MDPLYSPEFLLLLLEQEGRSLEDHTRRFLLLANATSFPDYTLCTFYNTSLNSKCRALSPEDGPREEFAAFMEWTLARNGSPLTVCPLEDLAIPLPTQRPASHHPAAEPETSSDMEQDLESATDQVCEPATPCIVGVLVEIEGVEESPAHTSTTEVNFTDETTFLHMMASESEFKVLSWNIHGLKTRLNEKEALLAIFGQYDVVLLQETHIGEKDICKITEAFGGEYDIETLKDKEFKEQLKRERKTMYLNLFSSRSRGVAILFNKPHTRLEAICEGGDYAWVHAEIDNQKYTFVSVYYHSE